MQSFFFIFFNWAVCYEGHYIRSYKQPMRVSSVRRLDFTVELLFLGGCEKEALCANLHLHSLQRWWFSTPTTEHL